MVEEASRHQSNIDDASEYLLDDANRYLLSVYRVSKMPPVGLLVDVSIGSYCDILRFVNVYIAI